MRVGFVGKGGAGKSTMAAAFIEWASTRYPAVFAIDADINRHLERKLEIPFTARELGEHFEEIARILEPSHPILSSLPQFPELGTIPVTRYSIRPTIGDESPLWRAYTTVQGTVRMARVGTYEEADFGTACIHVKLKGLELLLHRLMDGEGELCVLDLTAGTDPLSTSLAYALDLHLLVIEPTERSLAVLTDYLEGCGPLRPRVAVICNKVMDSHDEAYIRENVPADIPVLGTVGFSRELRSVEQGHRAAFADFIRGNQKIWEAVESRLQILGRDRESEQMAVCQLYRHACQRWASGFYNIDLEQVLDERGEVHPESNQQVTA